MKVVLKYDMAAGTEYVFQWIYFRGYQGQLIAISVRRISQEMTEFFFSH